MNAWPPQASYPCGNFSDTSCWKLSKPKGSIGRAFAVPMRTEHRDQASFCPFAPREVSVLAELALGHLRYSLTDVPPQSNSPPGSVLESDRAGHERGRRVRRPRAPGSPGRRAPLAKNRTHGGSHGRRAATPKRLAREHRDAGPRTASDARAPPNRVSKETMKVVVFHCRRGDKPRASHLCYTSHVSLQCQTRVKLNRVFFPR